jgi:cystathionine beta-lyase
MLLSNPHNPVGRVWKKNELRDLSNLCHRYGVLLLSDDIHADFIFHGHSYTPLAEAVEQKQQNFVQLLSPSKTFNISGLAMAFALVPDTGQRKILQDKIAALGLSKINTMTSIAVQAAYTHGDQWFKAVLAYIEENHQLFREQMTNGLPWVRISAVEGSFVAWVDLRGSGLSHAELKHIVRHEAKLMLFDGLSFGENGEYFFRFNLACPRNVLHGAINSFIKALLNPKKRPPLALDNVIDRCCCG